MRRSGLHPSIESDYEAMSRRAAEVILQSLREAPNLLLGAATGSTPTRTYELLAEAARREPETFSQLRVFKIDEWGGLARDDPGSCEAYVREKLLRPLGVTDDRYCGWNSRPDDPPAECARIEQWLAEHGPIGLCVLGIGVNGHLALIEPGEALQSGPHVAALTPTALAHPMLAGSRTAAKFGLTVGMRDILTSRKLLVLVSGERKAGQVRRLLQDPVLSTAFPASFVHLHSDVLILCDASSANWHTFTQWPST